MTAGILILQYLLISGILTMILVLTKAWRLSSSAKSVFLTILLIVYGLSMTLVLPLLNLVVDLRAGWSMTALSILYLILLLGIPVTAYFLFSRIDRGSKDPYPFPRFELVLEVFALALLSLALSFAALSGAVQNKEGFFERVGLIGEVVLVLLGVYLLLRGFSALVISQDLTYFRSLNRYAIKNRGLLNTLYVAFSSFFGLLVIARYYLL
jgi:hypothetical protein